ncbi:MAG: hypothetical protein RI974_302, partial [Actinomycetota bacterium]
MSKLVRKSLALFTTLALSAGLLGLSSG